ncbi:nitroreductase family protein [Geotalea uraniireducens]|uniref:Nitroreductase n=2 Tax=Geotalea uraniireducens TaxID=351604 RepID=A5G3C5_GEOUR|nr:nitroreductase family protein [Geotalea uraniireducens]ABQ26293.1 nitroreductase [Geotalea uraniireducens Rf4]
MSDMIELLRKRRSIRKFTPEKVAPETVELLIEALLRAPSSRSINPWEFVVVDDSELLSKLSRSKEHGSEFLKNAPLAIVVCADSTKSDVWVEDCSIASIIVQMAALSMGLGSCWVQIRNRRHDAGRSAEEYIRELLGLPEHIKVESIIGIGHPGEKKRAVPAKDLQYENVKRNRYA